MFYMGTLLDTQNSYCTHLLFWSRSFAW